MSERESEMIKVTKILRQHVAAKFGIDEDADDTVIRNAVSGALIAGTMTAEELKSLTMDESPQSRLEQAINAKFAELQKEIAEAKNFMTKGVSQAASSVDDGTNGTAVAKAYKGGTEAGSVGVDVRVKEVVERFNDTRTAATWDKSTDEYLRTFSGMSVNKHFSGCGLGSSTIDMPTPRMKAVAGAWLKHLVNKQCRQEGRTVPWQFVMHEQDQHLVKWAVHNSSFVGPIGYKGVAAKSYSDPGFDTDAADYWFSGERVKDTSNGDIWQKALLDDSTSGGLEAVPIEFDALYILTPLLTGQLFPLVNVVNVTRRRIEATKFANPSVSWGTAEGTAIAPYDTDNFISAFDNQIWPVTGAMEIGRDFMSDSPLDIGGIIVDRYGEAFRQEMDNVIATASGTNSPEGLFSASGVTTIPSAGGAGADPQVGDYEGMMHGVNLAFLQEAGLPPNSRAVFIGTQTSYQRARSIPVGAADARRVFGMNQFDYNLFGFRFAINASVGNANLGFFCLNRYRLYRRQGLEVRMVRDDRTGALANTDMLVIRARFGGSLDNASAGRKIIDAKA